MNVLSLFDGASGAHLALDMLGIKVDRYYSSEIDKHAVTVADANYPQDKPYRLGDMLKLTDEQLKALPPIHLMVGGSSCQDLSSAGLTKGLVTTESDEITSLEQYLELKSKGTVFFGQSYLFFEFVRIMSIVKPTYFLVENVKMSRKWLSVFESVLGVKGMLINSSNVVPQNRERYYFTNIPQSSGLHKLQVNIQDILQPTSVDIVNTVAYKGTVYSVCKSIKPQIRHNIINNIEPIMECNKAFHTMKIGVTSGWSDNKIALQLAPTIRAQNNASYILDLKHKVFRRLTVEEREVLQGMPVGYTAKVKYTQRVRITGNGFTIPVIAHLLKGITDV